MRIVAISTVLILCVSSAGAGVIYGSLTSGGGPLGGKNLSIKCSGDAYPGTTDSKGSYSINVVETGRCDLVIQHDGNSLSATVYSKDQPARNDFEIVRGSDGAWTLRKK